MEHSRKPWSTDANCYALAGEKMTFDAVWVDIFWPLEGAKDSLSLLFCYYHAFCGLVIQHAGVTFCCSLWCFAHSWFFPFCLLAAWAVFLGLFCVLEFPGIICPIYLLFLFGSFELLELILILKMKRYISALHISNPAAWVQSLTPAWQHKVDCSSFSSICLEHMCQTQGPRAIFGPPSDFIWPSYILESLHIKWPVLILMSMAYSS